MHRRAPRHGAAQPEQQQPAAVQRLHRHHVVDEQKQVDRCGHAKGGNQRKAQRDPAGIIQHKVIDAHLHQPKPCPQGKACQRAHQNRELFLMCESARGFAVAAARVDDDAAHLQPLHMRAPGMPAFMQQDRKEQQHKEADRPGHPPALKEREAEDEKHKHPGRLPNLQPRTERATQFQQVGFGHHAARAAALVAQSMYSART